MTLLRNHMTKLLVYELTLLTLAFGVIVFDFVNITTTSKPVTMHKQQQAALSSVAFNSAAFSKSCVGVDTKSDDLKTVVQRGFCSMSNSK